MDTGQRNFCGLLVTILALAWVMQGDDTVFFLVCVLLTPGSISAVAARLGWLTDEEKKGILDKVFAPIGAVLIVGGAYELASVVDAGRADFLDARLMVAMFPLLLVAPWVPLVSLLLQRLHARTLTRSEEKNSCWV